MQFLVILVSKIKPSHRKNDKIFYNFSRVCENELNVGDKLSRKTIDILYGKVYRAILDCHRNSAFFSS